MVKITEKQTLRLTSLPPSGTSKVAALGEFFWREFENELTLDYFNTLINMDIPLGEIDLLELDWLWDFHLTNYIHSNQFLSKTSIKPQYSQSNLVSTFCQIRVNKETTMIFHNSPLRFPLHLHHIVLQRLHLVCGWYPKCIHILWEVANRWLNIFPAMEVCT